MRRPKPPTDEELAVELVRLVAINPVLVQQEIGRRMMLERSAGYLRGAVLAGLVVIFTAGVWGPVGQGLGVGIILGALVVWSISWGLDRWVAGVDRRSR